MTITKVKGLNGLINLEIMAVIHFFFVKYIEIYLSRYEMNVATHW